VRNQNLNDYDKVRLILSAIIQIDVGENDRRALSDLLSGQMQNAIHNLKFLGVTINQSGGKVNNYYHRSLIKESMNK